MKQEKKAFIKEWQDHINTLQRLHNCEADMVEIAEIRIQLMKIVHRVAGQNFPA